MAIAVVLAVLAAVGVVVYTNSVKNGGGQGQVDVIVSNQDIEANTPPCKADPCPLVVRATP